MRILVVEDNEMNRDMLSRRLRRRGHDVETAVDGQAAVAAVQADPPDVVLMDMGLPVLDGWEAARLIKGDPRTAAVPVIALTAHAMAEDRTRALAAGCDDFDTKPVDLARLCDKIAAVTGKVPGATTREGQPTAVFRATRLADLADLGSFVEQACAAAGAGPDQTVEVRLATEEVFTNITKHGYGGRPGPVTVRIDASPAQLVVTITDEAPLFDPGRVQPPDLQADWQERSLGGLGWHLVHHVMDDVRHAPGTAGGNVVTLIKKLPGPPDRP